MPSHTPHLSSRSSSDSWNKGQKFLPEPQPFPVSQCPLSILKASRAGLEGPPASCHLERGTGLACWSSLCTSTISKAADTASRGDADPWPEAASHSPLRQMQGPGSQVLRSLPSPSALKRRDHCRDSSWLVTTVSRVPTYRMGEPEGHMHMRPIGLLSHVIQWS